MNDFHLPPELENLQRELTARCGKSPGTELKVRVAAGVRAQLRGERRLDFWHFAAAVALVAAVWFNLSLCAAQDTNFHYRPARDRPPLEQTARHIRELLPGLSDRDAQCEALLLCAGGNLVMYPKLSVSAGAIKQNVTFTEQLP
jgi:hypothetical protein